MLNWAISIIGEILIGAIGTSGEGSGGGSGGIPLEPPGQLDALTVPHALSATTVVMRANGSADGTTLPSCTMIAGNYIAAACITAEVEEAFGRIILYCGPDGIITLQSGLEMVPNFLTMSPAGISLSSEVLISMTTVENNVIVDPKEGITLQALDNIVTVTDAAIILDAGASVVTIAPEGITLESNGATLEIGPEGIILNGVTIELTAMASMTLEASADLTLDAPMIMGG